MQKGRPDGSRAGLQNLVSCDVSLYVLCIVSTGLSGATRVIVFSSDKGNVKISGGAGMLLRVNKNRD
jgi:hypothetical protein